MLVGRLRWRRCGANVVRWRQLRQLRYDDIDDIDDIDDVDDIDDIGDRVVHRWGPRRHL